MSSKRRYNVLLEMAGLTGSGRLESRERVNAPGAEDSHWHEGQFTPAEQEALAAVGMVRNAATDEDARTARWQAREVVAYLFRTALPIDEVATLLAVDSEQVLRRVEDGTLLAISSNGEVRIPALQFDHGAEVPNLSEVLGALPQGVDAVEVLSWWVTPDEDLTGGLSPRDFLLQGGDARAVLKFAVEDCPAHCLRI